MASQKNESVRGNRLLFRIVLSGFRTEEEKLYLRYSGKVFSGVLAQGECLSLDTYFNAFSSWKFLCYTTLRGATANLEISGCVAVELIARYASGKEQVVAREQDSGCERKVLSIPFNFSGETKICFHYLKITALKGPVAIYGGNYTTGESAEVPLPVHLAILICTYRRERYLIENLKKIKSELLDSEDSTVSRALEVYVTDNGRTIPQGLFGDARIHLFSNQNCGGSGGFTRSLIESLQDRRATHLLFMDDDICIDPNVILKIISIFRYSRPAGDAFAIAGGMLDMQRPTYQHEAGAIWKGDGKLHSLKHNLNLAAVESLFQNEQEQGASYGGWWCFAMPCKLVGLDNLPLPLFIKCDDIEYSLRNVKKILVMNGVGVWHEGFEKKMNTLTDYYSIRNELVVNSIYHRAGTARMLWVIFRPMLRAVAESSMSTIRYVEHAVTDYLTGIDFFLETDMAVCHGHLQTLGAQSVEDKPNLQRFLLLLPRLCSRDFFYCLNRYFHIAWRYVRLERKVRRDYERRWKSLITLKFWNRKLGLNTFGPNEEI